MKKRTLRELRLLPPFAIARLGSSETPMDNYDLVIDNPIGYRKLVPAPTFQVDSATGDISISTPEAVRFRDADRRIKPVAPFIELWGRFDDANLEPITIANLRELGLTPTDVSWSVHVGNIKAYRRTANPNDQIYAQVDNINDHERRTLEGACLNFLPDAKIPFGWVQYVKPSTQFPEIRFRFTPAPGKVYGPNPEKEDPDIARQVTAVYDRKNGWYHYADATSAPAANIVTNPGNVYAGVDGPNGTWVSFGFLDDECDGVVTATIEVDVDGQRKEFSAFARITAGPPSFAPDSLPPRTVHDELMQALLGPTFEGTPSREEVEDVVRRAIETVRLMNTSFLNQPTTGMARMDNLDFGRVSEPIFDPSNAEALAVRARHESVMVSLESGALAWFSRVLRDYDEVGDLTDEGRRKMPGMMRGADARHLALTRRQVSMIRVAAERLTQKGTTS